MDKLIDLINQNRNNFIVAIGLMFVSVAMLAFFWNDELSEQHKASLAHLGKDPAQHQETPKWQEALPELNPNEFYFVLDAKTAVVAADEIFREKTLIDPAENGDHSLEEMVNSEDVFELMISIIKTLNTGEPISNVGPYTFSGRDGQKITIISTLIPVLENEKVQYIIVVSKDISDKMIEPDEVPSPSKKFSPETLQARKIVKE